MNAEVILESPSLRAELCSEENSYVLEKAGQLKTLPGTGWVTTEQVAVFYEVSEETIRTLVNRHKDEFKACGYNMLYKKDLTQFHFETESSCFGTRNYRVAIFPRPAILLCGCLLRDSEVAKSIRSYLINLEHNFAPIIHEICANLQRLNKQMPVVMQRLDNLENRIPIMSERIQNLEIRIPYLEEVSHQIPAIIRHIEEIENIVGKLPFLYQRVANLEETINRSFIVQIKSVSEKISREQSEQLKAKVKAKGHQRSVWAKFNRHFAISRYCDLPAEKFEEARNWLDSQD